MEVCTWDGMGEGRCYRGIQPSEWEKQLRLGVPGEQQSYR
jgi:hypothetical protein